MTTINELEERIKGAEAVLDMLKGDLEDLKKQEHEQEPESLFGRWATHPEHGRVIITSDHPDCGTVSIHRLWKPSLDGATFFFVNVSDLTIDPLTLTAEEDYQEAPDGTIVEDHNGDVYVGDSIGWWTYHGKFDSKEMTARGTARVIRWGTGK